MQTNVKKLLVQHSPHKRTRKRSAGYSLAVRVGLVSQKIVDSGEVYVHISMIANVFFFDVLTPDGYRCLFAKHTPHKRMLLPARPHYALRMRFRVRLAFAYRRGCSLSPTVDLETPNP